MQDSFELSQNEKLKKDIKRLESAAKRTAEWSDKAERAKIGFDPTRVEKNISRRPTESAKAKKNHVTFCVNCKTSEQSCSGKE